MRAMRGETTMTGLVQEQGGKLVGEGFAGSGGHEGEGVVAGEDGGDDLFLTWAKVLDAEVGLG